MATSEDIKKRALELSEKTDSNSISPKEVGGIMHDLASLGENALRNGGTLGIRKVYASIAEMEADKNPKDLWGNPLKKGNLVVIYDGTTTGTDNNKVYAYMNPGWQFATHLDAGYATRSELSELSSELYKKNEAVFSKAGMFINGSTGAVESGGSDWKATDFIDVRNTEKIEFRLGTDGAATSIAYYSSTDESSYLSGSGNTSINNVVVISHKDFPVNTSYIRFSKRLSESPNGYARTYDRELQNIYRTIPLIEADVERAKDDILAIKTETSSLQSEVDSLKFNITNASFTISGKFINSADGALEQAAAFSSTEAISLQSVLRCEVNIGTNGGATSVAYYSSEDTSSYISGIGNTSMSNPLILLQSDFPTEAKYVRFCKRGDMSNGGFVRIFKDKAESNIDEETIKFNYEGKYINGEDGLLYNGSDFAYTDAVRLENLRKIVINISTAGGASSATYYDESGNRVGSIGNTTMGTPITIKEFPREASFVRFCKRISTSVGGTVLIYAEDSNAINRKLDNHWKGRVISAYGDSVTAICNGDFKMPYKADYSQNWLNKTAKFYSMKSAHGRGIGGQSYQWGYKGGTLTIVDEYGNYVNRVDNNTYDDYLSNPSIVNLLEGQSCTRGCLSSWDRITKMYPSTIKDTIDVVLVMCHNDAEGSGSFDEEVKFVEGSQTDKEWAESSTYSKYGGDYNLTSVKGSIASTVMKLQEWLPNATIVLMTPISGRGITGKLNLNLIDEPMQKVADCVREVHRLMSIPLIDMYATCGINGLNRTRYITDGIHPYSIEGGNMLAKAVVGGLNGIVHNLF